MQLSLTSDANHAEVLLLVLWIELRKGELFENTLDTAKCSTKVTLSDLLALEFVLGLTADTARILCHG